ADGVLLGPQRLEAGNPGTAGGIGLDRLVDQLDGCAAALLRGSYDVGRLAQQQRVDHRSILSRQPAWGRRLLWTRDPPDPALAREHRMVTALPTGIGGPDLDRERRDNNFDALRIIAALLVIIGHSFVLTGREAGGLRVGALPLEYIGVSIFFVISGYLITGSWERSRSVGQYVSSRALRIAPLLWAVVLVSAFVMGPLVSS